MTFLLLAVVFAALAFGGAAVGDPTFRPDRDPGHWQTTVRHETYHIGGTTQ